MPTDVGFELSKLEIGITEICRMKNYATDAPILSKVLKFAPSKTQCR
jgi:hypothetical protein